MAEDLGSQFILEKTNPRITGHTVFVNKLFAWYWFPHLDKYIWYNNIQMCINTADIRKSTSPQSSTVENSGGPMNTIVVPVLLSGKKLLWGAPLWGLLCWKNYISSYKSFGGPVKLRFSMWLPVLQSSPVKVQKFSLCLHCGCWHDPDIKVKNMFAQCTLHSIIRVRRYECFGGSSRYLGHRYVITPHRIIGM